MSDYIAVTIETVIDLAPCFILIIPIVMLAGEAIRMLSN